MCTRGECARYMGQWVNFQTRWGTHRGVIADINQRAVLVRVPRRYAPAGFVSDSQKQDMHDEQKLDLALAQYGYGYGTRGYGYGARWGYPGYGGWYGGWWWWWLAFAWIFALAFLW